MMRVSLPAVPPGASSSMLSCVGMVTSTPMRFLELR